MGMINVTCSVSNVSISRGDKIVFIPLLPQNKNQKSKNHLIKKGSYLTGPDCYFTPFSLPIEGEYDGYVSIQNVVKNENVLSIEKMLNITIENFVNIIGENRDWFDSMSVIQEHYGINKNIENDEDYLEKLGFHLTIEGTYVFAEKDRIKKNKKCEVKRVEKDGEYYYVIQTILMNKFSKDIVISAYNAEEDFLIEFYKEAGVMLNITKEDQEHIEIIQNLSGMFVLKEVYEKLAAFNTSHSSLSNSYLTDEILQKLGFTLVSPTEQFMYDRIYTKLYRKEHYPYDLKVGEYGAKLIHQYHKEYYVFNDQDIQYIRDHWMNMTNTNSLESFPEPADIENPTDEEYQSIQNAFERLVGVRFGVSKDKDKYLIYSVHELKKNWELATGEILDISIFDHIQKYDIEYGEFRNQVLEYQEELLEGNEMDKYDNPFAQMTFSNNPFSFFFRNWMYFEDLYTEPMIKGDLMKEFTEYRKFYFTMLSCNRFFFPAMDGGQEETHTATKLLLEVSHDIVNKKITKQNTQEE